MSFADIWSDLGEEVPHDGAFRRRIRPNAPADMYLVIQQPGNVRSLRVEADFSSAPSDLPTLPATAGIELRWTTGAANEWASLDVLLKVPSFADLFDRLIEDVTADAASAHSPTDAGTRVIKQIRRWQSFLRNVPVGLDAQAQQGLYGELEFLSTFLTDVVSATASVRSWTGGSRADQDFSLGHAAVEVKTTISRRHHVLTIASERQLDTSALHCLLVVASSLDRRDDAGTTLPDLIGQLRHLLAADGAAIADFEDRLFDAGYRDEHSGLYRSGYTRRTRRIFEVTEDFPRLTENMYPAGIADVRYTIAVDALGRFEINEDRARSLLETHSG